MSLRNVKLAHVSTSRIDGKALESIESADSGTIKIRFGISINTDEIKEKISQNFSVKQIIETVFSEDADPFFTLEVNGFFVVKDTEQFEEWIDTPDAVYAVSSILFPYARSIAKPVLESLCSADIDFPWFPPDLEKREERVEKQSPPARAARKKPSKKS